MKKEINYIQEINHLKQEKNAIILAHFYQPLEIQDIADFVGDSYDLSVKAKNTQESTIVFCGVSFMTETAKILSPKKTVLNPNPYAKCPMAAMIDAEEVKRLKIQYPGADVLCYINTTAEVKAVSDVCVTSSSALRIVNKLLSDKIIFVPDKHLADYVQLSTDKKIIPGRGYCYVHIRFQEENLRKAKTLHPDAKVIVHPECSKEVIKLSDMALGTSGMIKYVEKSDFSKFIIGTEKGLIDRMARMFPDKTFYSAGPPSVCFNMKKIRLKDVHQALLYNQHEVNLPADILQNANKCLEKMIEYSK